MQPLGQTSVRPRTTRLVSWWDEWATQSNPPLPTRRQSTIDGDGKTYYCTWALIFPQRRRTTFPRPLALLSRGRRWAWRWKPIGFPNYLVESCLGDGTLGDDPGLSWIVPPRKCLKWSVSRALREWQWLSWSTSLQNPSISPMWHIWTSPCDTGARQEGGEL